MLKLLTKNALLISVLLLMTSLIRLYFFARTSALYSGYEPHLMIMAFLHGLRFDLSVLMYFNFFFFVLVFFERFRKSKTFHIVFAFFNSLIVGLSLADVEFYLSYGKKISPVFLSKIQGTDPQTLFYMSYPLLYVFMCMIVTTFLFYKITTSVYSKKNAASFFPIYFVICFVPALLGVRGGTQKRVLGKTHIHLYTKGKNWAADLTSNTVHNLMRNWNKDYFPKKYTKGNRKLELHTRSKLEKLPLTKTPKNVVIIFVESLSSYVVEKDNLLDFPFFKNNPESTLIVPDAYANGRHSIDALMATFFGVPSYFDVDLIESKYLGNKWVGMPKVLGDHGFESVFLHAARRGTQFFDSATNIAGFDSYRSILDENSVPDGMRGLWGVHDDFLYDKSIEVLNEYKSPFLATLFTTSLHVPFVGTPLNPKSSGDKEQDYFEAAQYANQALERFFEKASKTDWYSDSLFIVLADHNPPIHTKWSQSVDYGFKIPMIFYQPGSNLGEMKIKKISQQIDIPLSIFQILNLEPKEWSPYGASVFDLKAEDPIFYTGGGGSELTLVSNNSKKKAKLQNENAKDSEVLKIENLLYDYIYRLENDEIYN